jgi:hypothetical protein
MVMKILALVAACTLGACGFSGAKAQNDAAVDAEPDAREGLPQLLPEVKDYGQYLPGGPSQTWVFTVQSISPVGPLTVSLTGMAAADYTLLADGCTGTTLAAVSSCTVAVKFSAVSQIGARDATLKVTDGGVISLTSMLKGRYDLFVDMTTTGGPYSFGTVPVGTTAPTQTITVNNTATVPTGVITLTKLGADPAEFTITNDTCSGLALNAKSTCSLKIAYAPNGVGARSAMVQLTASPGGTVTASASGSGEALRITTTPADFGTVVLGSTSVAKTLTVTNVAANAVGPIVTSLAGNHPGDFLLTNDLCNGMTLPSLGTCTVDVQFKPTVLGLRDGLLRLTVGGVIIADGILRGTADPVNTLVITPPTTFAFPDTMVAATSTPHAFTVTNTGTQPSGLIASALAGTDPTQFSIVTATDTCTAKSIPAAGTCSISIVFAPTSLGAKSASLTLTATPGGTATATVSGTGTVL